MAHLDEPFRPDWRKPATVEQDRAWNHVERVFGRQPSSIRCISESAGAAEAYFVKLEWAFNQSFEFICACGLLVGSHPRDEDEQGRYVT